MPNVMAALPNIGGTLCSTPQSLAPRKWIYSVPAQETAKHCAVWLAFVERRRCSNKAKKQKPLKFARVPQTNELSSAASG